LDVNNPVLEPVPHLNADWIARTATPAKAGVQKSLKRLDSGFRRNAAGGFPHPSMEACANDISFRT